MNVSAAAGAGGTTDADRMMVATPVITSVVVPSSSVAVAVSVKVKDAVVPAGGFATAVIIAPFGVAGSTATVPTVGSEDV